MCTKERRRQRILRFIRSHGHISLAEFMLFTASLEGTGYYQRFHHHFTQDFLTSPEMLSIFGRCIGLEIFRIWKESFYQQSVQLVELGPGTGNLMHDILSSIAYTEPLLLKKYFSVHLVESSRALMEHQKNRLSSYRDLITWHRSVDSLPDRALFFIGHEFFDALPIYQFVRIRNTFFEKRVTVTPSGTLDFILTPRITPLLIRNEDVPQNGVVEISPLSCSIARYLITMMKQHGGYGLIIDYGYINPSFQSTLRSIQQHQRCAFFHDPGNTDISSSVDFGALHHLAIQIGISAVSLTVQSTFLKKLHFDEIVSTLLDRYPPHIQHALQLFASQLTHPQKMGTLFKCLTLLHPNH